MKMKYMVYIDNTYNKYIEVDSSVYNHYMKTPNIHWTRKRTTRMLRNVAKGYQISNCVIKY